MLVPTVEICDWKDLQNRVTELFREMGYVAHSPYIVHLVRGQKEVDVFVSDPRTSVPHTILVECKHWARPVTQDTVHSMQTIMQGCAANAAIIVSSGGFQSGAGEAAANSNVQLMTWESLQVAYGHEWFLRQKERMAPLEEKLRQIDRTYLDQWETPKSIMNHMRFERMGRLSDLYALLNEGRMVQLAIIAGPKTYDQPGPIQAHVNRDHPNAIPDRHDMPVLNLKDVRAWFRWALESAQSVIDRCEGLENETFAAFEALGEDEADRAFNNALHQILEESPVRVLRDLLGNEEYHRLIGLLQSQHRPRDAS